MRVLLVEDEPGVSEFVQQGLTEAGYAVDVAYDGVEGLDYALAAEYDVMILDVMMPKMDGISLLRELRGRGIQSPVLLLTARIATPDRVQGLDAGADDYLVKPFAFAELLARIRALLRRPPLQTEAILKVGDLPPKLILHGDEDHLVRLFLNLVENAIKYTPTGGQISVQAESDNREIRVGIQDTGPGIPPEHIPHLFERFYRVDNDRSRATGGSGLGLSLAYQIVQQHKGKIEVQSTIGKGSTFTVYLPVKAAI